MENAEGDRRCQAGSQEGMCWSPVEGTSWGAWARWWLSEPGWSAGHLQWQIRNKRNTGDSAEEAGCHVEEPNVILWTEGSFGERCHDDDFIVHQLVGLPVGWTSAENKEKCRGYQVDSMRTSTRGGNGTKGKTQELMKKDFRAQ